MIVDQKEILLETHGDRSRTVMAGDLNLGPLFNRLPFMPQQAIEIHIEAPTIPLEEFPMS